MCYWASGFHRVAVASTSCVVGVCVLRLLTWRALLPELFILQLYQHYGRWKRRREAVSLA